MVVPRSSSDAADEAGYASAAYATTLSHLGEPVALRSAGGWLLRRRVDSRDRQDLIGPYPVLCCARWSELARDLARLRGYVSVTAVIDPLAEVQREELQRAFCDHLVDFKRHYLVDLGAEFVSSRSSHHRRGVRRARRTVEVTRADDPSAYAAEWCGLYSALKERVAMTSGPSDFTPASLEAQLSLRGMRYYRARSDGVTVAASLWLRQGNRMYYHLGASRSAGRLAKASYGIFDRALADAAQEGLRWACLGGVAGLADDPDDGLAFFKRGWSTDSVMALLGGRVLDREAYAELGVDGVDHFPAYRARNAR